MLVITDPVARPRDSYAPWERVSLRFIQDPRDLPFVKVIFATWLVLGGSAAALFLERPFHWWHGALHLALIYAGFFPHSILMLHNTSHRAFFKPAHKWLKAVIPWTVTPLLGVTPESYFAHHVGMHHVEDNQHGDLSTTLPFKRDSWVDFTRYYLTFMTIGLPLLARYFWQRKRWKLLRSLLLGELTYYLVAAIATYYNPMAALFTMWLPLVLTRLFMMAGNWAQHAFIDADAITNTYRNSATCINSFFNHRAFNDGYHIGHHLKATMHWTEMPVELQQNLAQYDREGAIVFTGLDWGVIWLLLMVQAYPALARKVVNTGTPRTQEELIELLKSRARRRIPAPAAEPAGLVAA